MDSTSAMTEETSNKRSRSLSGDLNGPPSKSAKTQSSHLQINYLARQYSQNIPLAKVDDNLSSILRLIGDYDGVLHRHESLAGNLGACPLGPILIKRFERLFDGPPRILKSHGKDPSVTWLDVVDFARNKPEQFNLEKMRNGVRVCHFYTKQCRVEISEEDFVLIASGMPQKLIPPQPIEEDEEKELGVIEILERNLSQIVQMADQGMASTGFGMTFYLCCRSVWSSSSTEPPAKKSKSCHNQSSRSRRGQQRPPTIRKSCHIYRDGEWNFYKDQWSSCGFSVASHGLHRREHSTVCTSRNSVRQSCQNFGKPWGSIVFADKHGQRHRAQRRFHQGHLTRTTCTADKELPGKC